MKRVIKFGLPIVLLVIGGVAYMTLAGEDPGGLSSEDRRFLVDAADARMMDWAEGNLAVEKSAGKYQRYGRLMMQDQTKLMQQIKDLAKSKNMTLSDQISEDKSKELSRLKACSGETFNRRFRRMIIKDHKRDIREFQRASESTDPEIKAFAKQHIQLLESHLEKARELNQ